MPEARVFRRAGRGKSASPVRRGESEAQPSGCHSLSYSTGSDWNAATGVPSGPGAISYYGEPRPPFSSRSIALANSPGV